MFASKAGHLFLGWSKLCYESEVAELLFPGMICFYWIEVRDGKEAKQDHNDFCVSQERLFFSDLWVHSRTGCRGSAPSTTSSIWSKQQNPVCWSTWVQSLLNLSQRISWKNCLQTWHPVKSTAWIDTVGLKKDFLVENVFLANPAN